MPIPEATYILKMNQDVKATVDTPFGMTESFEAEEIVRQGTVWGPQLCSVSTDRINKMHDNINTEVNGVVVKSPVFVDDMNGMGGVEKIEDMGRKMKVLETTKKFSFNNMKGKSEILPIKFKKKKKAEEEEPLPLIKVRMGTIPVTAEYKFLGDWYDEKGSNTFKIKKKMEKLKHVVNETIRYSSYNMVGNADVQVRMMLLEMIVKPTLLYNTEAWIGINEKEEKELQKHHYEILRKCFEQKHGTSYYGIIAETGIWPYKYVVIYKRLMLLHNIIHSDERRIIRQLILNQKELEEETWYSGVKMWMKTLNIPEDPKKICDLKKSAWKKLVKGGLQKIIEKEVMEKVKGMTKTRFLTKFGRHDYLKTCNMATSKEIMKIRLNMVEIGENFRGKYAGTLRNGISWCLACGDEAETTEHVIQCKKYRELTKHKVVVYENCFNDTEWLLKATNAFKLIEDTREILQKGWVCWTKEEENEEEAAMY